MKLWSDEAEEEEGIKETREEEKISKTKSFFPTKWNTIHVEYNQQIKGGKKRMKYYCFHQNKDTYIYKLKLANIYTNWKLPVMMAVKCGGTKQAQSSETCSAVVFEP